MSRHLVSRHRPLRQFRRTGAMLRIGKYSAGDIAKRFGTPLYVYDSTIVADNLRRVRKALPTFEVAYSLKANPNLGICRMLRGNGCLAEVASGGELSHARTAGFTPKKTIFAGPAKQRWELEAAVGAKIASINVESERELLELDAICKRRGLTQSISLRVNTRRRRFDAGERMVGGPSRFGLDEEILEKVLRRVRGIQVKLEGIHVYSGSQILDADTIGAAFADALRIWRRARTIIGPTVRNLFFGGGFGVPNDARQPPLDLCRVGLLIRSHLAGETSLRGNSRLRVVVELGRYLTANAGVFLTRVVDVKHSRGVRFVSTDGGMNAFMRPVFMSSTHPIFVVDALGRDETMVATIGGPLCTPLDVFARRVRIPPVSPGQLIGIFNAGAYGRSMSPLLFLSQKIPGEVVTTSVGLLRS